MTTPLNDYSNIRLVPIDDDEVVNTQPDPLSSSSIDDDDEGNDEE